jgi:hypothetical protein
VQFEVVPKHYLQGPVHGEHTFPTSLKLLEGQLGRQVVPVKYNKPAQEEQEVESAQVLQIVWQLEHKLPFIKVPLGQVFPQVLLCKYVVALHDKQVVEEFTQFAHGGLQFWHVKPLLYVPFGQEIKH